MVKTYIVKGKPMTLTEFKKGASQFYPYERKTLKRDGKIIAIYSPKTKRVKMVIR